MIHTTVLMIVQNDIIHTIITLIKYIHLQELIHYHS